MNGVGSLNSHSGLTKGELITLTFTNSVSQGDKILRKIDIKLSSNTTIYSMRFLIGRSFKCAWNEIKIMRLDTGLEIKDDDNSKTVSELRFRNNEIFACKKRAVVPID